ncbi:MAG: hypothetical protein MUD01_20295 [Chloroflexaceae bacterium]|nr:hypothetical protein [Chloroflexaceae bacterium]
MATKNPTIERTTTTFILRDVQLPQGCWLTFGSYWLVTVLGGLGCFIPVILSLVGGAFVSGYGLGSLRELVGGLGLLTLFMVPFLAVGVWMLWMALRVEHTEVDIWTFDKAKRVLVISQQVRNRKTNIAYLRQVGIYPLPTPGTTRVRSLGAEIGSNVELVVQAGGRKLRGMRGKFRRWHLTQVVRELDDFLVT